MRPQADQSAIPPSRAARRRATLRFLGTGTSMGVPTLGCDCPVCHSTDPRDRRLRPSILLRWSNPAPASNSATHSRDQALAQADEHSVLIDTGPDFREQALACDLRTLDAVLYTHSHADHILGLDDLRPLSYLHQDRTGEPIPLFVSAETRAVMEHVFSYTFSQASTYSHRARVALREIGTGVTLGHLRFQPIRLLHGALEIVGWRFGPVAYLTDVSAIPEASFDQLHGLDVLILSALRHKPHPSHATVAQAVQWAQRIGARQTWLTHISHDLGHQQTNSMLPSGIQLAWDGLTLELDLDTQPIRQAV